MVKIQYKISGVIFTLKIFLHYCVELEFFLHLLLLKFSFALKYTITLDFCSIPNTDSLFFLWQEGTLLCLAPTRQWYSPWNVWAFPKLFQPSVLIALPVLQARYQLWKQAFTVQLALFCFGGDGSTVGQFYFVWHLYQTMEIFPLIKPYF